MEDYGIDSTKLMYHLDRLKEWRDTGDCFPIYMELSPIGKCNHRCIFCALDYLGYNGPSLDSDLLIERLREAQGLGLKAAMLAGEGEPLLHPDIKKILCSNLFLDKSLTTNGVLLDKVAEVALATCSWIRVSLDAGTPETHTKLHRCNPDDFYKILKNLAYLVKMKREGNYQCTLGVQLLLLRENKDELVKLAKILSDIGVDYLSIKPYSHHPSSDNDLDNSIESEEVKSISERFSLWNESSNLRVIFRWKGLERRGRDKPYERCLGLPFFAHLDCKGEVYSCSTFLGNPEFSYGNIYKNTFKEIWTSEQRRQVLNKVATMDTSICRENCRLDAVNEYLWNLKYPSPHINFI